MSYHHSQRLLAHWQPKRKPEGSSLTWGSRERYESLTGSAKALALAVSIHLNNQTNTREISNKTLQRELGLSKDATTDGLKELVEWGIFSRTRRNNESSYCYSLLVACPPECEHLDKHYTPSELATLPKEQASPEPKEKASPKPKEQESLEPKEQARVSPENRQLIETNKNLNRDTYKQGSKVCSSCIGEKYLDGVIHQQECPYFQRLKTGQPWAITRERNISLWDNWDNREKQKATLEGYKRYKDGKDKVASEEVRKFNRMVADQSNEQSLLPLWSEWLQLLVQKFNMSKLPTQHLNLALEQSKLGQDLEEQANWREYPHNQPLRYYNTEALAEA